MPLWYLYGRIFCYVENIVHVQLKTNLSKISTGLLVLITFGRDSIVQFS